MTYPFWRQIVLSFSSGNFYQEISHQPLKQSLRYLALLIWMVSLILSLRYAVVFSHVLEEFEGWAGTHLPEIWIEGGEARSSASQPWRHDIDRFTVIVDTTGKTEEIPSEFSQGLLLTRHHLILKQQPFDIRRYELAAVKSFHLNAEAVRALRQKGIWVFWPVFLVGFFGYFIIGKSSQIILFSGVSMVTSVVSGRALPYRALLNIGIYTMSLPFLVAAAFLFWGFLQPFFGLFFVAMYGALLVTAVLHCAPPRQTASEPNL